MNLGQFLGLPMTAGPRDIPRGEDELGNILYEAQGGARYTKKTAPANNRSIVKALAGQAKADPWGTIGDLVKGAAQGAWDAVAAPGRSWSDSTMTYGDVANTAGLVSLPAVAGKYDPAVANMGIRAYHGSPHDFDRFDSSKIGTGEGAQAYGHGLYFAEAEDVAKEYKKALGGKNELDGINARLSQIARERDDIKKGGFGPAWPDWDQKKAKYTELGAEYDALMEKRATLGHMYEVNINADPADFLDWDAPLSEQPAKVRDITDGIGITPEIEGRRVYEAVGTVEGWKPGHVNNRVSELAANKFREAGIPGIKYYDQGSRASGQGTRNYVVFDDSLIEILRKYGLAGAAPLGAILGTQDDEKQRIRDFLSQ